jgi:hypothetical protein
MFPVVAAVCIGLAGTKKPRENGPKTGENRIFARLNSHTRTRDRATVVSSSDDGRNAITHQRNRCRGLLQRPNTAICKHCGYVATPPRLCIKSVGFA